MPVCSFIPRIRAWEQALWGTLAAGQEKEGEHATTSLEFKFHLQFPCGFPAIDWFFSQWPEKRLNLPLTSTNLPSAVFFFYRECSLLILWEGDICYGSTFNIFKPPSRAIAKLRASLHGGGGPQVSEVTPLGGVTHLSIIISHFNLITFIW